LIDASATQTLGASGSTTDRDGNPRAVAVDHSATPVDLGAYEYQPPAPAGGGPGTGGGTPGPGTGGGTPGTGGGTPGSGGGTPGTGGGTPGSGGGTPGTGGGTPGTGGGTPAHGSRPIHPARTVKLTALGHATVTGRRISLRLSCSGTAACSPIKLTATAIKRHRRVTVGSLSTRLSAGHTATVTLTLNRAGRALLANTGRLTVTLNVTVRNGARTTKVETAHVML
jgi:hypothetical protein